MRDTLILLSAPFVDPAYPEQSFYCWHCMLIEGLLARFPAMAARLDVERLAWPKPRARLVEALGSQNQSLPVLILASDAADDLATGTFENIRFVNEFDAILRVLATRHGIPNPHP